jgi:hypothetical protein
VVTQDGIEKPLIELLDMPRPFKKLRELDIEQVIANILVQA